MRPALLVVSTILAAACHRGTTYPAPIPAIAGQSRTLFELRAIEVAEGTGRVLQPGNCAYAHYTGWLTDGKKFDSSRDTAANGTPKTPISFPQGARRVIAGWDLGFEGMKVGGRRRLIIPYQLAYGERGRLPTIPPKATLIFDVELMAVADTVPRTVTPGSPPPTAPQCAPWNAVKGG